MEKWARHALAGCRQALACWLTRRGGKAEGNAFFPPGSATRCRSARGRPAGDVFA